MFKFFKGREQPKIPQGEDIIKTIMEENRLLQDQVNGLTRQAGVAEAQRQSVEVAYQSMLIGTLLKYTDEIVLNADIQKIASSGAYLLNVDPLDGGTYRIYLKEVAEREPTDDELKALEAELDLEAENAGD